MIGSKEASAVSSPAPSASAICSSKRLPRFTTKAMRVENTPFSPVSFS